MNAGIDIGYSWTKAIGNGRAAAFASVVGTPDRGRFSLDGGESELGIELIAPRAVLVGDQAVIQSRHLERREDRAWIESPAYYDLLLAAFSSLTEGSARVTVVSGLPIQFYERDRETLLARLLGEHQVQRAGRRAQRFEVIDARVIPQGFGALLAVVLDDRGRIVDADLANGRISVVDVGGKTTNLLSVDRLSEVGRETASVPTGTWGCARAVGRWLADNCPGLELRDHQVIAAMMARETRYYGERVDLGAVVDQAVAPLADQVVAQATQLWNGAAGLDAILIAGGGAHLVGARVRRQFRHARVIAVDPMMANAVGYWRFSQRVGK